MLLLINLLVLISNIVVPTIPSLFSPKIYFSITSGAFPVVPFSSIHSFNLSNAFKSF
jgi:hypothetical protein